MSIQSVTEAYSEVVRRYFTAAAHAGELTGAHRLTVSAAVDQPGAGPRVALSGGYQDGRWQQLRYRVFGCPHLIAAAEWACERFEGEAVESIRPFPVPALMQALAIPVEKTGRILLLEDAFVRLDENLTGVLESGA